MLEVIYALWRRDMIKFLRDRRQLVTSLTRSFIWLLAFGLGMRTSVQVPTSGVDYVSFLVPGLASMTVLFASMFAAISIVWEREFGFLKELLVAPVPRGAIVAAKILAGSATALIETSVMLLLSPLAGARFNPWGALASLPLLGLFGMTVIQPVFFLSGALYPIGGLPRGLRAIVFVNPMTYVVDAVRGLCIGHHTFPLPVSLAVIVGSAVLLAALATRSFRKMEA